MSPKDLGTIAQHLRSLHSCLLIIWPTGLVSGTEVKSILPMWKIEEGKNLSLVMLRNPAKGPIGPWPGKHQFLREI